MTVKLLRSVTPKVGPTIPVGNYSATRLPDGRFTLHVGQVVAPSIKPETVRITVKAVDVKII